MAKAFLDTLTERFAGNPALFRGLYAHPRGDWGVRHPVIRLSWAEGRLRSAAALDEHVHVLLSDNAERQGVTTEPPPLDTALLDNLTEPDVARMRAGAPLSTAASPPWGWTASPKTSPPTAAST